MAEKYFWVHTVKLLTNPENKKLKLSKTKSRAE